MPELFRVLRVLVDRPNSTTRFLVLGSASPELVKGASETLAGRVEFVELSGFDVRETGPDSLDNLWLRGGFPRSFLAAKDWAQVLEKLREPVEDEKPQPASVLNPGARPKPEPAAGKKKRR
jgi:predicted AAA+ superfamily ATPase